MKTVFFGLISSILCLASCNNCGCEDFYNFEYDYKIEEYFKEDSRLWKVNFFKNGLLIAKSGREGDLTKYIYNNDSILIETYWGRQCGFSIRTIYRFDSLNNCIGEICLPMKDTITDVDTVQFQQTKFYDNKNRLVKELTDIRYDSTGYNSKIWSSYVYDDRRIKEEYITRDSSLISKVAYKYDLNNNLVEKHENYDDYYVTRKYKYNDKGWLTEEYVTSNEYPLTPKVLFSTTNNRIEYQYDSSGFQTTKCVYNHRNELQISSIYKKILRTEQ